MHLLHINLGVVAGIPEDSLHERRSNLVVSKPDNDHFRTSIDLAHVLDLMVSLCDVTLVDTKCIYP
jgi:hypothetical protein